MAKTTISDDKLSALRNEIVMSRKFIEEEIAPIVQEAVERYTGHFTPHFGASWDIILNEVYPIIQNQLPAIFFQTPRVFLKPRNKTYITKKRNPSTGVMEEVQVDSQKSANTQSAILNYLLSQIGYKKEVRKVLLDALLFPFGVMWHGYKGNFGMTEEKSILIQDERIFVQRISPFRFIKDPGVSYSNLEDARWVGREIDMRLEDLIEDETFDVDKKLIKGFEGFGDRVGKTTSKNQGQETKSLHGFRSPISGRPLLDFADSNFRTSTSARFVRVQEIFIRPSKKERREGKKGKILVLTDEQTKPLRINDWNIKAEGFPAKLLEFNPVNDRAFGIPDIDVYKSIADQKNIITNLQIRNAQENTKVWVGINKAQGDEEDIQKIQEGTNSIILFDGDTPVNQRMFVASPGSVSSDLYALTPIIQKNLEDKSGITDLKRGFIQSGEESATSVRIRNAGGSARPAYRRDIMADFLRDSMLYSNQLNQQFLTITDAVRIVGSLDLEWSDNPTKEEIQADVDVEIDPISMIPEDPQRELEEFRTALGLAIDAIRDPALSQKIAQEGKTVNISPLIEQILLRLKIRNPDVFRNIKPEESEGFVSVKEIREAKDNVNAALTGKQIPFPPKPEDDHVAKLETYTTINELLKATGKISDVLDQLIQIHQSLLAELQSKEASPGQQVKLTTPGVKTIN